MGLGHLDCNALAQGVSWKPAEVIQLPITPIRILPSPLDALVVAELPSDARRDLNRMKHGSVIGPCQRPLRMVTQPTFVRAIPEFYAAFDRSEERRVGKECRS